ncbi:MAG: hypothetical protein ABIN67_09680 [Ferruginibacter sp.]
MRRNKRNASINGMLLLIVILVNAAILKHGYIADEHWYWLLLPMLPLTVLSFKKVVEKKHS